MTTSKNKNDDIKVALIRINEKLKKENEELKKENEGLERTMFNENQTKLRLEQRCVELHDEIKGLKAEYLPKREKGERGKTSWSQYSHYNIMKIQ